MRVSLNRIAERKLEILNLLEDTEPLSASGVSKKLEISASTTRRYIKQMEMSGQIVRTYNGIIKTRNDNEEDLFQKYRVRKTEKRAIAIQARKLIDDGDIILIGGGSTTYELAKLLVDAKNLHVVTLSIPIAMELFQSPNLQVEMVGGIVNHVNGTVTSAQALSYLNSIHIKKAFLGADSISVEYGITTPSYFEADVEKNVIKNSDIVYILADYSKFNKVTLTPLSSLDLIHCIITDSSTDREYLNKIESLGVQIMQVSCEYGQDKN